MSGIGGIFNLDGKPLELGQLGRMRDALAKRGPDAAGTWSDKHIGLVHRLLATYPEALDERQPLAVEDAAWVLSFDGRIDNREDLKRELASRSFGLRDGTDAELVLRAYQCWDESCADRLLGDFSFAIWDARRARLFCARDIFGCRPFYYHYRAGEIFAFASAPESLFAGNVLSRRINEARVGDFLVSQLEGVDKTCSFYHQVLRLPPAHTLTVDPSGLRLKRYWQPLAGPELKLASDEEYEEAFLERFVLAVRCRTRGGDRVASMLSGGLDSSSIVGVASRLRQKSGNLPLHTYSAISQTPKGCRESEAVQAMLQLEGLDPTVLGAGQLDGLMPGLAEQTWNLEDPFDFHMIVPRSLNILARQQGMKVMLDGSDGDSVLSGGMYLARLVRQGKFLAAWRAASMQRHVYPDEPPAAAEMIRALRAAFVPGLVRAALRPLRRRQSLKQALDESLISPEFAASIHIEERLERLNESFRVRNALDRDSDMAGIIDHSFIVCGVERYERVAAANSLESRHPFLDRRLVEFCIRLPDTQKIGNGWPKSILRRSMKGQLPNEVCWRIGKRHLGQEFTAAYARHAFPIIERVMNESQGTMARYLKVDSISARMKAYEAKGTERDFWHIYEAAQLANWINQQN